MKMTPKELKEYVKGLGNKKVEDFTHIDREVLYTIEHIQCEAVLSEIRAIRENLPLFKPNCFLTFYIPPDKTSDDILLGCRSCLNNVNTHIRHTSKCNVNCQFCYYRGLYLPDVPKYGYRIGNFLDMFLSKEELFLTLEKQFFGKVTAIGWLGKEPLLELERLLEVASFIRDRGVYQYLYTNGVLMTKDTAKKLRDAGIEEVRFNLQATDFDDPVLKKLEICTKIINNTAIETPIYTKSFRNFLKHRDLIINSGIKQINMPELQVSPYTFEEFFKTEGLIYRHRKGYTSPIVSRQLTYKLIELALKEQWPIIINDCSNDTKLYRDTPFVPKEIIYAQRNYKTAFTFLPLPIYMIIIDEYIKDGIEVF